MLNKSNAQLEKELKKAKKEIISLKKEISLLKQSEKEYLNERNMLNGIIELNPYSIAIFDKNGYFIRQNGAFWKLFKNSYISPDYCLFDDPHLEKQGIKDKALNLKKGDVLFIPPVWYNPKDVNPKSEDSPVYMRVACFPVMDDSNNLEYIIFMHEDLTDLKKAEQQLLKQRSLDTLCVVAGGIGHDYNNILSGILIHVALASKKVDPDSEVNKYLNTTKKFIYQARDLSFQLQTLAADGTPIIDTFSLVELITENVKMSTRGTLIDYELSIDDKLHLVDVDEGQIGQVFSNIVINAVQAMPNGGTLNVDAKNISLRKNNKFNLPSGKYVRIGFKDEGCGISKNDLTQVFDPFFTTKEKGTGLGLATSYSIIKKHNGIINVESKKDKGTIFEIYLPVSKSKFLKKSQKDEGKVYTGSGRILVIDDESEVRSGLTDIIKEMGYKVDSAKNGKEAQKLYKKAMTNKKEYDLLLIDYTIKGSASGEKVLEEVKKLNPKVKAVLMSGYSNKIHLSDYKKYGFVECLRKPFLIEDLSFILHKSIK